MTVTPYLWDSRNIYQSCRFSVSAKPVLCCRFSVDTKPVLCGRFSASTKPVLCGSFSVSAKPVLCGRLSVSTKPALAAVLVSAQSRCWLGRIGVTKSRFCADTKHAALKYISTVSEVRCDCQILGLVVPEGAAILVFDTMQVLYWHIWDQSSFAASIGAAKPVLTQTRFCGKSGFVA